MIPAEVRLAKQRLEVAGVPDAAFLAEALGCRVRKCRLSQLLAEAGGWSPEEQEQFEAELGRLLQGEPLAYLAEQVGFYGRVFRVTPATLIPRPDSETLVDVVLAREGNREQADVLDLGTGSGCLLLSLLAEKSSWRGLGVDQSPEALVVAEENATRLQLQDRAAFRIGNWSQSLPPQSVDLLISNPPYVVPGESLGRGVLEFEPALALLTPLEDPYFAYRAILADVARILRPGGALCFEVGASRAQDVAELCRATGLSIAEIRADLGGVDRVVHARFTNSPGIG